MYIEPYSKDKKDLWNDLIDKGKNTHFMFNRNYMDYHSHRFIDRSLMFFKNRKLIAILPANINLKEDKKWELVSHGGLTFGGMVCDTSVTTGQMIKIFNSIIKYCRENNISNIIYKPIPYIYNKIPSDEDLYALFRCGFKLIKRDLSSTIYLNEKLKLSKGRKYAVNKALKNELQVERSFDFKEFMELEYRVLKEKYNKEPVHTADEIKKLSLNFPENIKLFICHKNKEILAGTIIYENLNIAHTQYMAVSKQGEKCGALDIIIYDLINKYYKDKIYFDFGISTENNGLYLNEGLIRQKEMFGGRAVAYDCYELTL
ncbi:GNAT family N-acetyltransferase [Clostridium tetanomorphum]|uniref:GNAT family N-acetyltransferase n=1 Tax=Clostridium tetanomorphum TaxID=1553 RepID=A0A923E4S3_CLOTT|nr:GNAT family N-acetyltransferase [Clostridium tetanomorphum]